MKDFVRSTWQWLAETRLARCLVETLFRSRARNRIQELDQGSVSRSQTCTLLGLVHKARGTRFGREHDFRRIRTCADFRRLVPLRTPAELWRSYWEPAYPDLAGSTWPGPLTHLAVSSVEPSGTLPYVPFSPELLAAHQTAALSALAFVVHARPRTRLWSGKLCLLGNESRQESFETLALATFPRALSPYAISAGKPLPGDESAEQSLWRLAEKSSKTRVTCLAGTPERLKRFLFHVRRAAGRADIMEIWPHLAAVLCTRGAGDFDRAELLGEIGSEAPLFLEIYARPEGVVGLEDPRCRRLRLIPDQGVYFEFVPLDQLGKPAPDRLTAAEVEPGQTYALAISSPAGVWACLAGTAVCFEQRDPPLFRLVQAGSLREEANRQQPPSEAIPASSHPYVPRPPHLRSLESMPSFPGTPWRPSSTTRRPS